MERPVYFLPSEVSRLVLGYLKETEHMQSYKCFLNECKHLSEYADMLKQGIEYPTTIMGISLITMLQEYARLKLKETALQGVDMGTALKQFDAVTKKAKEKTDQSKTTPSNQPRKRPPRRSTARKEDSKNNSEKQSNNNSMKDTDTEEFSTVTPVCRSSVRINPKNAVILAGQQVIRRKPADKKESITEVKMASQIFSLTPSSSGVACTELEFPEESQSILKKRKKRKSKLSYRPKYGHRKRSEQLVVIDSDLEDRTSDGNISDALPDLDTSRVSERMSHGHRETVDHSIARTSSTQYSFDTKLNRDRRKNDDNGDMSDDSLSRSDVVFDSTHHTDFDLDLHTDPVIDRNEDKKEATPDVRMIPSNMSDSSYPDSHALHIDHQSPVKMTSLQQMHEQRTPVKAFLQESQTCDSGKSPRRKRHQPKRHSDVLEVLVPPISNHPPPQAASLPPVNPPPQHKEDTVGQTDPFPMLLEKIINDTRLHERLAETINKSRFTNHPHVPCNKPVPTSTIVDDFFSPGGHNMLSEDTIDGIIHMTKTDPLFDSLLSMLGPEGAKAVATTMGMSTTTTSAPHDQNNSAFVSVPESDMVELSQDGFTTSTAPTGISDSTPSNTPQLTSHPAAGASSPCPSLTSPCPSLSSSVGSPGQPTNQKKRRIKPTPCHPLTSVLPAFSSPIMHEMSPAATPEACSPAPSPYLPPSTSAQNSLMSPPPCTATHNPMSSPAPYQHQSSPAPTHQPSTPAYQPSPVQMLQPLPAVMEHQPEMIHQMSPAPKQNRSSTTQIEHQMSPAILPYQPTSASIQHQHSPASFQHQPSPAQIEHQQLPVSVQNQLSPAPIQNQPSPYGQQSLMSPPATIPVHKTVALQSPSPVTQHQPCSPHVPSPGMQATDVPVPSPASSITSVASSVHSAGPQHPASPFLPGHSSHVLQDTQASTSLKTSSQILAQAGPYILAKDSSTDNQIPSDYSQQSFIPQTSNYSSSTTPSSIQVVQTNGNLYQGQAPAQVDFPTAAGVNLSTAGALLNVSSLCQAITGTSEATVTSNQCASSTEPVAGSVARVDIANTPTSIRTSTLTSVPTLITRGADQFPGLVMLASAATTSQQTVHIIQAQNNLQDLTPGTLQLDSNAVLPQVQVQSLTSEPEVVAEQSDTSLSGVNISIQENGIIKAFSKGKTSTCSILPLPSIPKVSVRSNESPSAGTAQPVAKPRNRSGNKSCLKDTSMIDSNLQTVTSPAIRDLNTVHLANGSLQTVTQLPDGIVSLQPPVSPVTDAQSILGPLASGHLPPGMVDTVHTSNTQMSFDLLAENNLSQFALQSPKKGHGSQCPNVSYPTVVINDQVYELAMSPNSQSLNVRNPKPLVETGINSRPTVTVIAPQLPIVKQTKKRKNRKKQEPHSTLSPVLSALKNVVQKQTPKGERPNILLKSPKPLSKSGLPTDGYFVSPNRTSEATTDLQKQSSANSYVAIPIGKIYEDVPKRSLFFEGENTSATTSSTNVKEKIKKKTSVKSNKAAKLKAEKVQGLSKAKNVTESKKQTAIKENSEKAIEKKSMVSLTAIKPCCVNVTPLKQTAGTRLMSTTPSSSSPIVQRFQPLSDQPSSSSTRKVRILEPVAAKSDSKGTVPTSLSTTLSEAEGTSSLTNLPADDQTPHGIITQASEPTNYTEGQSKDLLKAQAASPAEEGSSHTQNPTKSPAKQDINGNCGAHSEDSLSQDSSVMTAASDPGPVLEKGAPVGMRGRKMVAMMMSAQSQQKINGSSTTIILSGNRKRTSSQVAFDQNGEEKVKKKKKAVNLGKINLDHILSKIHKK